MSKTYYAIMGQSPYDLTVQVVEADSIKEAKKSLFYGGDTEAKPLDYCRDVGDELPDFVLLFPATAGTELTFDDIRDAHLAAHDAEEKKEQDEKDRAEFERLKRKFSK